VRGHDHPARGHPVPLGPPGLSKSWGEWAGRQPAPWEAGPSFVRRRWTNPPSPATHVLRSGRRRRRSLLIIDARGAIPNEMGPTRCRATPALNQSADEIRSPASLGRGPGCVTLGLPSHDCILLVEPRNRQYRLRHSGQRSFKSCVNKVKPCSREVSVSWITPGNCAGYWKDQPGCPSEKLGGRTARTCSRGYPGPQTMTKYRINKFLGGARFARRYFVPGARLRLGANTSCSFFLSRENWQTIGFQR
jgi:hypothetical protein